MFIHRCPPFPLVMTMAGQACTSYPTIALHFPIGCPDPAICELGQPRLSQAQCKHELSRNTRGIRWGIPVMEAKCQRDKAGTCLFCAVFAYTHVMLSNMKSAVSSYTYSINAINNLFFCCSWETKFGILKKSYLMLMCSDCSCKYMFLLCISTILMWWPNLSKGLVLRGGALWKTHQTLEPHSQRIFSRTDLRTILMCCLL